MWKTNFALGGIQSFEPTTSCIRGKRLTARPRGPHGRERTTLANAGGRGFESHRGQNLFFTVYSITVEWNVMNCFIFISYKIRLPFYFKPVIFKFLNSMVKLNSNLQRTGIVLMRVPFSILKIHWIFNFLMYSFAFAT